MTKQIEINQYWLVSIISTITFFSTMLTMLLQVSIMSLDNLQFVAIKSNPLTQSNLYFKIDNRMIEYDILIKKDNMYLLNRYRQPNLYQALLNSNLTLITDFELLPNMPTQSLPNVPTQSVGTESDFTTSTEGATIYLELNGDKLPITFDTNVMFNSFQSQPKLALDLNNDFKVIEFSYKEIKDELYNKIRAIPLLARAVPTLARAGDRRYLTDTIKQSEGTDNNNFLNCVTNIIEKSYLYEHTAVEGSCVLNGESKSILGFAGMNSYYSLTNYGLDVIYVLSSLVDNYASYYSDYAQVPPVKIYDGRVYDFIVGHSAGASVAKYAILNNKIKAKNILTFGTPNTRFSTTTGFTGGLTQFIKAQDDAEGCCVYNAFGFGCKTKGVSYIDPVTLVGVGTQINQKFIGSTKYLSCKASLPMVLWNTGLSLHIPFLDAYKF